MASKRLWTIFVFNVFSLSPLSQTTNVSSLPFSKRKLSFYLEMFQRIIGRSSDKQWAVQTFTPSIRMQSKKINRCAQSCLWHKSSFRKGIRAINFLRDRVQQTACVWDLGHKHPLFPPVCRKQRVTKTENRKKLKWGREIEEENEAGKESFFFTAVVKSASSD